MIYRTFTTGEVSLPHHTSLDAISHNQMAVKRQPFKFFKVLIFLKLVALVFLFSLSAIQNFRQKKSNNNEKWRLMSMKSKRFNDQSELTTPPPIQDNNSSSTKKSADSTIKQTELLDQKPRNDVLPKQPQSEHQQPNPSQMISLQSQRNSYANLPIQQGPIISIQKPLQQNDADSLFRPESVYQLGNPLPKAIDRFVPPQQSPSPAQLNSPSNTPSLQHTRQLSKSTETRADFASDGPSFQPMIIANQNENIQNPQIQPKPQQLPSQSDKQLLVDLEQEQELKPVLQQNNQLQQPEDDHYQLPEHEETTSSISAAHASVTGHEVSTSLQETNEPFYSSHDSDNIVDHSSSDDEQSSSSEYIGLASMNTF